jgi:hypothetical protein
MQVVLIPGMACPHISYYNYHRHKRSRHYEACISILKGWYKSLNSP